MDRVSIKEQARANFKANYGISLGVTLVYALLMGAVSGTGIGAIILEGPLTVGYLSVLAAIYHNDTEIKFEELFSGFKNFGGNLVASLLVNVFTALWSLLFVIPGIVKSYSYAMTLYIMKDNPDMDGYDAIQESRKMMKGHKWELFVFDLSFLGWYLLSALTFGLLAIFYVGPYHSVARAGFYEQLVSEKNAATYEN